MQLQFRVVMQFIEFIEYRSARFIEVWGSLTKDYKTNALFLFVVVAGLPDFGRFLILLLSSKR